MYGASSKYEFNFITYLFTEIPFLEIAKAATCLPVYRTRFKPSNHTFNSELQAKEADRASATAAVDSSSIPGRFKPKNIKIGIHSFPAWRSAIKRTV